MPRQKQSNQAKDGQVDVFGKVHGLENLVMKPDVIQSEGLKVIHFAVKEGDKMVPGFLQEVKTQARRLVPEVKSRGKPPWMNAAWQAKQRKKRAGIV